MEPEDEERQRVQDLVEARRRLLPTLLSLIDCPSVSLQQFGVELGAAILSPLQRYHEHSDKHQLEEMVEPDDDCDFVDEGGWYVARCAMATRPCHDFPVLPSTSPPPPRRSQVWGTADGAHRGHQIDFLSARRRGPASRAVGTAAVR